MQPYEININGIQCQKSLYSIREGWGKTCRKGTPNKSRRKHEDDTKLGYNGNRFLERKLDSFDFFVNFVDNSKSAVTRDCPYGTQDTSPKITGPSGLNLSK
jgi:hypothetical protein